MSFSSITQRFVAWFLMISLLPIVLIGYSLLQTFETELQRTTSRHISAIADKKMDQIDSYLNGRVQDALTKTQSNTVHRAVDEFTQAFTRDGVESDAYRRLDTGYRDNFKRFVTTAGYYDLFLISPQGTVVYSQTHEADFATNLFTGPYRNSGLAKVARNALNTLESGISEFEFYAPSGQAIAAFIAVPIMDQGKAIGVLALQIDDARVSQVVLDDTGLGESSETVVARREDAHSALVMAPLKSDRAAAMKRKIPLDDQQRAEPLVHALNGERGSAYAIDYSGKPVVAAWRYLPRMGWGMVVKVDAAEALAPYYRVRSLALVTLGLALFAALIGALLLGRRVIAPLKTLSSSAQALAAGKLEQRVAVAGRDELGELAVSFNAMAARLQSSHTNLEAQVAQRTAELTQSLANLRIKDAAIASSINAIAIAGLDGKLSYVNQAFVELWRLQGPEDALGRSPLEFWEQPEDAQAVMEALLHEGHWQGELRARLHDGALAEMQLSGHMVKDETGKPICMMGSFVDITARKLAEQELQKSEALLDSIITNMPAMVFVKRASDLRFERLNRAGEKLLGFSEQELLDKNDYDFFPREQADFFSASDREVLASRQLQDIPQEPVLTRKGETRILHTRKVGIYNSAGEPTHLLGVSIDITEQIHAEEALQHERDFASSLVNTAPVIVLLLDAEGLIEYVNPYFEQLTGYRLDEIKGKEWFRTFLPARDQDRIRTLFQKSVHDEPTRGNINPIVTRSGKKLEIEWYDQSMRDAKGKVISVLATGQDVSARRTMELALNISVERLNEAQHIAQVGSWELDLVKGELIWSDEIFRLFEIDKRQFGATYEAFLNAIHPDDRDSVNLAYTHSLETRVPYEITHRLRMSDGRIKWVHERCTSDFDAEGKPLRSIGTVQDITRQMQNETALIEARQAAEAASRAKSEFLANMSHEIRTPMNAILGLTQLVLDSELAPRQQDFLKKAHTSAQALLGILNDILDFSKIEAGHMGIEQVPFRLEESLNHVADLFGARIEEKGLELFFEIAPDVPAEILGDPLRLTQVLTNLVSNAVKFTERGEIHVKLEVAERTATTQRLRFAVRDTGIGLSRDQSDRLFQPFTQADGTTTRKYGGTGLGLSICQRLVGLMGGEIAASGAEGQGTTFTFTIQSGVAESHGQTANLQPIQGLRTLVVDDQETSRIILQQLLQGWGLEAHTAASGEEALAQIEAAQQSGSGFDVVLLDWRMPDMDGLEVVRRLEQHVAEGKLDRPLRVVMVTAHDREQLLAQAQGMRLNGILTKPVTPSHLLEALANCRLPETLVPLAGGRGTAADASADPLGLQGVRVLLVEDNALNRLMAAEFLTRRGVVLTLAQHGGEALERVKGETFDAVLMDLHMPVMDGLEATRLIRELPGGKSLPIIAMTAAVLQEDRDRCAAVGMVDFIAKPINPEDMIRVLLKWVKSRGPSARAASGNAIDEVADGSLPASLPGFDLATTLHRLDGNRDLLARLLLGFAAEQSGTLAQLDALLQAGDNAQAAILLHTLKGVAANLGAEALTEAARQLEESLKRGDPGVSRQGFADALNAALDAISTHVAPAQSSAGEPAMAAEKLAEVLNRLAPYLQEQELVPVELMDALRLLARTDFPDKSLARLMRQLDHFDHDGALASVVKLAALHGVILK